MTHIAILDPATALATADGWEAQKLQWQTILSQGVLPKSTDTVAKCIAIAKLGEERFGWSPMDAVTKLQLVEGKIELAAEAAMGVMQQRAIEEGGYVRPIERSLERAAIEVMRPGWPKAFEFEYTQEDAKLAGLWGKTSKSGRKMPWSSHPKDMLWARCVSRVSRGAFADATGGAYTFGELTDQRQPGPPAGFDEVVLSQLPPTETDETDETDEPEYCEACNRADGHEDGCPEAPEPEGGE